MGNEESCPSLSLLYIEWNKIGNSCENSKGRNGLQDIQDLVHCFIQKIFKYHIPSMVWLRQEVKEAVD